MPYLLEMTETETGLVYFFLGLAVFIVFLVCLRIAVRATDIVKNQQAMIWFLILMCEKNGASPEEIKKIKDHYDIV